MRFFAHLRIATLPLVAACLLTALPAHAGAQKSHKGTAVAFPWAFQKGTDTARTTAATTVAEIAQKAGYDVVASDKAASAWNDSKLKLPAYGTTPSSTVLKKFGRATGADVVLYGSVKWHTRSIWVNAGPKTISTATVTVYAYDVKSGKVTYKRSGLEGRSDEKTDGLKVAGAILISPLVTAVSGGPATPQEQRAVQIALARAYESWAKKG